MTDVAAIMSTIEAELAKPYVEGESDCLFMGLAVADALDPSRGLVERYRGVYSTLPGARRALLKAGFKTVEAFLESHLKPLAPARARIGDLVTLHLPVSANRMATHVGVCIGARFVTKLETGRSFYRLMDVAQAFRAAPDTAATGAG